MRLFAFTSILPAIALLILLSSDQAFGAAVPIVRRAPSSKWAAKNSNGGTVAANKAFTINMAVRGHSTGNFVNAQQNHFSAPQQLDNNGVVHGHSHVVVEKLTSHTQTTPTNPKTFAFFQGLKKPVPKAA